MGRVARYTNFYDDDIFDDEDREPDYEFDSPIAMKDVPEHELKKMQMIKTLMDTWDIDCAQMVLYLQRFIFKKYRDMDEPDDETCEVAKRTVAALRSQMKKDYENNDAD